MTLQQKKNPEPVPGAKFPVREADPRILAYQGHTCNTLNVMLDDAEAETETLIARSGIVDEAMVVSAASAENTPRVKAAAEAPGCSISSWVPWTTALTAPPPVDLLRDQPTFGLPSLWTSRGTHGETKLVDVATVAKIC